MIDINDSSIYPSVPPNTSNVPSESQNTQPDNKSAYNGIPERTGRPISKKRLITGLMILGFIITGLVANSFTNKSSKDIRTRATVTGSTFSLSPATKQFVLNGTFPIGIILNTNANIVSATDIRISYDPTAVEIISFTPGTRLPVILTPETHGNGVLSVTLGAQPTTPFQGSDIIGTFQVKMIAMKASTIAFTNETIVTSIGKTGNTLTAKTGTTITTNGVTDSSSATTITPTATATLTPTPTATNTPTPTIKPTPTSNSGICSTLTNRTESNCVAAPTCSGLVKGSCLEYPLCCTWTSY